MTEGMCLCHNKMGICLFIYSGRYDTIVDVVVFISRKQIN